MIQSGAETPRVEDSLYRLAESYNFQKSNFWVVPSNIQATILDANGNYHTQIRHIRKTGIDFDRLDQLNSLSRYACEHVPDEETLKTKLDSILNSKQLDIWKYYLGGILGAVGFGVFFNCDFSDAVSAALSAVIVVFLSQYLSKHERNPLILNFLISFATECTILLLAKVGIGNHTGTITVGVIMLLISALGTTNGVRDLIHLDTLSGIMNITTSLAGACGIAFGIAVPLLLLQRQNTQDIMQLETNAWIALAACTCGCIGFALWFHVRREKILFCGFGGFLTWALYLTAIHFSFNTFLATFFAAICCGLYAQIIARIDKAPATIFQTVAIFPLIPGAALYYSMYGIIVENYVLAKDKISDLLLACVGIVLGFLFVEVISRFVWRHH